MHARSRAQRLLLPFSLLILRFGQLSLFTGCIERMSEAEMPEERDGSPAAGSRCEPAVGEACVTGLFPLEFMDLNP